VVRVVETLTRIHGDRITETVDRDGLAAAQTPQGIRRGILHDAWRRFPPDGVETFTDEAALLEACTIPVHVVPGQPDNLKVTVPADLERAATVLGAAARPGRRIGFGDDAHPFGPGAPLALGGIEHAGAPRLHGHSDGDVVLHAVADALLGAAGLGDLGRLFPADARTPRGIASAALVEEVVARLTGIPDAQPDAAPHWGVTFGVDDADAIAAKAAELGGRVDVPPFDAPWVRMTIVTDPQGATFTASQFKPENADLG
jgi:2-C-methyl-D-erythritol 4-phosphate cytidylyltransferase/2-C-methyl-D-erythritol 2,4-cyclodiphosphate synthase